MLKSDRLAVNNKFVIGILVILILSVADMLVGAESVNIADALTDEGFAREIFLHFRLPKLVAAILSGLALSGSGLVMQTVFRNPLAGPYMLGVSAGASLGVALFMMAAPFVGAGLLHHMGVAAFAWLGAVAVLLLVMFVSVRLRDIMAVLILGMMIGSAASAVVDVLQFFSSESALKGFVLWSMGSIGGLSWPELSILFVCVICGIVMTVFMLGRMDSLLLGENYAATMGVDVKSTRTVLFVSTALLAGGVTAFCGPIAFIGLAAPHIARLVWKRAPHRILYPAALITGVVMMILCDIFSSIPLTGCTLPLNTITAMFGIPVVFMVVWRGNRAGKLM